MRLSVKQYRERLYQVRSHPARVPSHFHDQRDSFLVVYLSVLPFGVLEYFSERLSEVLPVGLVFPLGYLLFWAFYYSYYKPGFLEDRLGSPGTAGFSAIPGLVLATFFWYARLFILTWVKRPIPKPRRSATRPQASHAHAHASSTRPAPGAPAPLPSDILEALHQLSLKPGCGWHDIHRQYRALAKQLHPDLHPESTDFGRRFIKMDAAYHKLGKVRSRYFPD